MKTNRKLLGIDIDGVFNIMTIDDKNNKLSKTCVHYLNRICEEINDLDILIVSSWGNVNNRTTDALVLAGFKYPEKVIDYTPFLPAVRHSRTLEIEEWKKHNDRINYYETCVYLDDEPVLYDYFTEGSCKNDVVVCRPDRGLDIDKAYETICRLQGIRLKFWS